MSSVMPLAVLRKLLPGLALCANITLAAYALAALQSHTLGRAWLEPLVLAILIGAAVRTTWSPPPKFDAGLGFAAKTLLEAAIVLLGLSVSVSALVSAGPALIGGIAALVAAAIAISYGIGRGMGLPRKLALLIACGNSICGNSAIAAVAPVIQADSDDIAASIAFTAVLGVIVVLALPLVGLLLHLSKLQYGVFAGLTVYAVPQVLATTTPVGAISVQSGTLVKLGRVLMLGPVLFALALLDDAGPARRKIGLSKLAPPFILGFLALAALRAAVTIPPPVLASAAAAASVLTIMAMAALGLGVDAKTVAKAGPRVTAVAVASLACLGAISLALIYALRLP